jgi:methionyl-tRNA synthetase
MKFYITTTLPYVNADPHIGFALEIIQADVLARYHRWQGDEVFFNTGTDEHGLKIYRKALEEGISPQAYCDRHAANFDKLKEALNLTYNNFIRTTDEYHKKAAQDFWRRCKESGDIYLKKYKTTYCVGCELEKTKSELVDGRCPIHPNLEIETIEEENYFFRYSKYQDQLLKLYEEHPLFVIPEHRLNEIREFTKRGLEDFSISRLKEKMPWGVLVPDDDKHVMYVWFDALVNYISALGWPENVEQFNAFWPAMQVAGKDNLRQQSSMWQAMLLSAGLRNSRSILIHGFVTVNGQKMSKSLGNVVDPFELVKKYGTDAVRYYLLREISTTEDGDFTEEKFKLRYNADLANGLGNFASRVLTLAQTLGEIGVSAAAANLDVQNAIREVRTEVAKAMEEKRLHDAVAHIWRLVSFGDKMVGATKPWELEGEQKKQTLTQLVLLLDEVAHLIEPFIPGTAHSLQNCITHSGETITSVHKPEKPLFARL